MKSLFKKLAVLVLPVILLGMLACSSSNTSQRSSSAAMAEAKTASGSIAIDEYQIMWMVGGDIGGGTLEFQGQSHKFEMGGLKLGGFGAHKVKLDGDVWEMRDVADFPGVYAEAEVGFTVADAGKGDFWLKNDKGVYLRLRSPKSKGIALDLGVEGVDIRLKK
jgi:hypothetical protein